MRGDAIDIYQVCTGVGFGEACRALGADGMIRRGGIKRFPIVRKKPNPPKKGLSKMDRERLQTLWDGLPVITKAPSTQAGCELVQYLESHGIDYKQAADFELPYRLIPGAQWFRGLAIKAFGGVPGFMINKSGNFFLYNHAICWGYRDAKGINQLRFRVFGGKVKALQFADVHPILYDVTDISHTISKTTCICEGEPDTIACANAGLRAVGVAGASQSINANDWHRLLVPIIDAVVCVQGDDASAKWQTGVVDSLEKAKIKHSVYQAPRSWDIADMMAKDKDRALSAIVSTARRCE